MPRFINMDWSPGYLYVCPHHVNIRVRCQKCGKEVPFDRAANRDRTTTDMVKDIEKRLKCSGCGAKQAKMLFGYVIEDET